MQTELAKGAINHQVRALLAMVGTALLLNYVETMVVPGVYNIQTDFRTTSSLVAWVTSAFLIVGSAVSPLFGKLGDSFGKKKMFLVALAFYTGGVGLAGFSPSIYFLIASRAIQGIGFAIIPLALAIIAETFPKERIAAAQGVISATFAIGAAMGLIVGSYIIQNAGWQWAFHSAFVLSVVLFVVIWRFLPRGSTGTGGRVDYQTIVLLMAGISLLLLYLTEGPYEGWYSTYEIVSLVAGFALTLGFFVAESRRPNPLIQLSLLRIRNVLVANGVGILSGTGMFMLFFAVIYYTRYQPPIGLGLTVLAAGLTMAPATVVMLVVGPGLGRLVTKVGPKPTMIIGALVALSGFLLFIFNRTTTNDVMLAMSVSLAGSVGVIIPIVNMISISLPRENVATGLGLNTMLRNIGGAIGPVVATTIMSTYSIQPFGSPVSFPTSAAFDYIFYGGVASMVLIVILALAAQNYVFKGQSAIP